MLLKDIKSKEEYFNFYNKFLKSKEINNQKLWRGHSFPRDYKDFLKKYANSDEPVNNNTNEIIDNLDNDEDSAEEQEENNNIFRRKKKKHNKNNPDDNDDYIIKDGE